MFYEAQADILKYIAYILHDSFRCCVNLLLCSKPSQINEIRISVGILLFYMGVKLGLST
jgi:hypothetical protein